MPRLHLIGFVAGLVLLATASNSLAQDNGLTNDGGDSALDGLDLFNQRIMPIFRSPEPSSCVQCHLSSVDLKNYILPSHEKTFVSLRDQGLIDLESPEESKILTLIRMGDKDLDRGARMIHRKTRRAEYDAFASWIQACCQDSHLRNLPPVSEADRARPANPDEVIRHARKSRVVDSFVRNVWSQRMRCYPCHTPFDMDPSSHMHQSASKTLSKIKETYGEDLVKRLGFFRKTPEKTMQYLIERSQETHNDELPLLNLENPRKSLLVLKPMSKLPPKKADGTFQRPSFVEPVSHGGGLKMHPDDQSYKSFVSWIQDYANVVENRYTSVDELPADNWYASKLVLRLTDAPASWETRTPVQLFLHAWDQEKETFHPEPIAFTQGPLAPRKIVNGGLFLLAPKDAKARAKWDPENATLPRGRYLVKVYVDLHGRLAEDPTRMLGNEDYFGQGELNKPRWREGFRHAESISGKHLEKLE